MEIESNNKQIFNSKDIEAHWQKQVKESSNAKNNLSLPATACIVPRITSLEGFNEFPIRTFVHADATARFLRSQGKQAYVPVIFDSLGEYIKQEQAKKKLPAQALINQSQRKATQVLHSLGIAFTGSFVAITSQLDNMSIHQRLFIKLRKKNLLHKRFQLSQQVCESCKKPLTGLTPEHTRCPSCYNPIIWNQTGPWLLKLNRTIDPVLKSIAHSSWPRWLKQKQQFLIGRNSGVDIIFKLRSRILDQSEDIKVFVNRPELILGMGFLHIKPDNPILDLLIQNFYLEDFQAFRNKLSHLSAGSKKTLPPEAIFTGINTINPITLEQVPVMASSVVPPDQKAMIGIPAYNEIDRTIALKHKLPIRQPFGPLKESNFNTDAVCCEPDQFEGQTARSVQDKIIRILTSRNIARKTVKYRLRSFVCVTDKEIGVPVPFINCKNCGIKIPDILPYLGTNVDLEPTDKFWSGKNPQSGVCPECHQAISSGFSRIVWQTDLLDPVIQLLTYQVQGEGKLNLIAFLREKDRAYPFLKACCLLNILKKDFKTLENEPFKSIRMVGHFKNTDFQISKLIERWGTDTLRIALLTGGSPRKNISIQDSSLIGALRALARIFYTFHKKNGVSGNPSDRVIAARDKLLYELTPKLKQGSFHKAFIKLNSFIKFIAQNNILNEEIDRETWLTVALCLIPFAPHHAAELYKRAGGEDSIFKAKWPKIPSEIPPQKESEIAIFINGKLCDRFKCSKDTSKKELGRLALSNQKIKDLLHGKRVKLLFTVENHLVNIVPERENGSSPQKTDSSENNSDNSTSKSNSSGK